MYFSAICEGVPRSFTSGPVLSKLRVSGFCDLRLRPRPRRFCCPCLIGSRSYRSTDLVSHRGEMHVSCDSYLVTRNSPPLGFSGSSQAGPRVFASIHNPRPDYPIQTRVPRAFGRQAKWPIVPAISQMRMRPGLISPDVANAVTGGILVLGLRRGVARSTASPGRMLQLLSARCVPSTPRGSLWKQSVSRSCPARLRDPCRNLHRSQRVNFSA